ncbi:MAG TPA: OprD family porin [Pseudomonas sp.]|jgi:imipenem/basic amino acid-specific outer membrane pore|uniref:OprD family porin n=1 Tax=Pseudomonas sp. TaxID=306 RepID=UPI002ED9AD3A
MKLIASMIVLATASAASVMAHADQAESKGFIEDSSLKLLNRNFYFSREYRHGETNNAGRNAFKAKADRNGYNQEWVDAISATYNSGFTQGLVGFGLDAYSYYAFALDTGGGRTGTGNMMIGADGHPEDSMSKSGGALKMRISDTTFRYGTMSTSAPVFAAHGSRVFPATVRGLNITSSEIKDLDLEFGHFTAGSGSREGKTDGRLSTTYSPYTSVNNLDVEEVNYLGGLYKINDELNFTLYGSDFKDVWHQYYGNANYTKALSKNQSLLLDFNIYKTNDSGDAKLGPINNVIWSMQGGYTYSAHTFTLAWQQVHGDTPFDYLGFGDKSSGDSIFVANSVSWSDFNAPGEKSWQARYDLNLKTYGVPGVSFMARYLKGWDIDGSHTPTNSAFYQFYGEDARHHELDLWARYVVQSGSAKDLSFRLQYAIHRANAAQGDGNIDETRLIVDYPINVF